MSGIMNMFVATKTTIATAVDAFFNSVSLLLNTSSTNGAQNNTFLDSSTNNFAITRNGNTTQGTFTPFSQTGWSNFFEGTSAYLSTATSANFVTTGDFTIEAWAYSTGKTNDYQGIVSQRSASGGPAINTNNAGVIEFQFGGTIIASVTMPVNQWFHVAMSRSGSGSNNVSVYLNGTRLAQSSITTSTTTNQVVVGRYYTDTALYYWQGYVSNVRYVTSSVYSGATITVPTAPLTAITNTQLLTCQSNRFVDNSSNAFTLSLGGTPSVQAFSPFLPAAAYDTAVVGGSGYFDGSGDSLVAPYSANLMAGTGDFTWEAWLYPISAGGNHFIFDQGLNSLGIYRNGSNKLVIDNQNVVNLVTSTNAIPLNAWTHYAFTRSGTTIRLFVNGVLDVSGTSSTNLSNATSTSTVGATWPGYISSHRFVVGTAVYTSAFTPPTAPLTAITNTSLLLSCTNAGIYDSASKNVLETIGNAQVSTTQAKWGTTAMYFDGNGDWLLIPNNQMLNLNADFTIEFWIYLNSTSSEQCIFHNHNSDNNGVFVSVNGGGAGKIRLGAGNGSSFYVLIDSSTAISASTWTYVACTRSGSTWTVYINGSSAGTATSSSNPTFSTSDLIQIGRFTSGSPNALNAYIGDLRITKYARTISASPTAAFPLQ